MHYADLCAPLKSEAERHTFTRPVAHEPPSPQPATRMANVFHISEQHNKDRTNVACWYYGKHSYLQVCPMRRWHDRDRPFKKSYQGKQNNHHDPQHNNTRTHCRHNYKKETNQSGRVNPTINSVTIFSKLVLQRSLDKKKFISKWGPQTLPWNAKMSHKMTRIPSLCQNFYQFPTHHSRKQTNFLDTD